MKNNLNANHLICANCEILLDCDWMGISMDYDDECRFGGHHCAKEIECDCEEMINVTQNGVK
jgi:hypothetical protein